MIDENAFGIFVSYFAVEDDEYGLERAAFLDRVQAFRATVRACLVELPLGRGVRAVDLGHAVHVEVADGEQTENPLSWAKKVRARLAEQGFETAVAVTHGGRWVEDDEGSFFSTEHVGDVGLVGVSNPSEPLRRALYADAATRPGERDEGWGPGLYLDTEAAEALGMAPKNAPTVLELGGATFYRAGR
jgi:hypothetical protein